MIKPDEETLVSILNLKKVREFDVFLNWLESCLARANSRLVDDTDTEVMLRDQGYVKAIRFVLGHIDKAREDYDSIRKGTA